MSFKNGPQEVDIHPEEVLGQADLAGEDEEHVAAQRGGEVVVERDLFDADAHVRLAPGGAPPLDPRVEPVHLVLPPAARRQHLLHDQDLKRQ